MCNESRPNASGIVLAGVHRWGESEFERLLPRPLLPVAESPLICYALRWLRDGGVVSATVCANSESHFVRHLLKDGSDYGLDIRYFEDLTPRGPAGCVRDAGLWGARGDLIVTDGCVIPTLNLSELLAEHRRTAAAITVVVEPRNEMDPFREAMPRATGIFVFSPRALEAVPPTGYQDIKELLIPALHKSGERVLIYHAEGECLRVTDIDSYMAANEWMIERIAAGEVPLPEYRLDGSVGVGCDVRVADDARLIGPILMGPRTRVGPGATIVGPTVLGADCVIEERALVSRSVVWDRCRIGTAARIDECILATGSVIDSGERIQCTLHTRDLDRAWSPGTDARRGDAARAKSETRPGTAGAQDGQTDAARRAAVQPTRPNVSVATEGN
ncbi:MAG: NDP-sugar synthase [Planctomycetes bacterium]|nr:NDP-sugar synthase [Planctomycetota bacterium]